MKKLLNEIKKYVKPGANVVIACSGGADSIALTDVMYRLQKEQGYKIAVVHIEHGLRGAEALADAAFTEKFCAEHGLQFECRHVKAAEVAKAEGLSVEDAARRLRYRELWQYVDEIGADLLLTAHHADDQAETVLMQLLRGCGTTGLSGMQVQTGRLLRPLLFVSRSEIEAYCREHKLSFCSDSTNDDLHYTRNRVRKELMPYLKTHFNPQLAVALGQTAQLAAMDDSFSCFYAQKFFDKYVEIKGGLAVCSAGKLLTEFDAVSTRVIRMMWERKAEPDSELGFEHIKAVLRLVQRGNSGKTLMLPGKTAVSYSYGKLCFGARSDVLVLLNGTTEEVAFDSVSVNVNELSEEKVIELPGERCLHIYISAERITRAKTTATVPLELADSKITIRTRRDGDRFYPYGGTGSKKLKEYFIDCKISRAERDKKLLAAAGSNILWIIGEKQAGWKNRPQGKWLVMHIKEGKDGHHD